MKTIAVYNIKGGVGKTTTAVNVSYFAAASGQRTLLWDLDCQAAASFAYRVRPRIAGFGKKILEHGEALGAGIKETDYTNLDVLPADFAYRKFDRMLGHIGHPARAVKRLLEGVGHTYDIVFLDCPPGLSQLTEGLIEAADLVLVPTIPTVLSFSALARLVKWAERVDRPIDLMAFLSMIDRRRTLHRRASDWVAQHPEVFLSEQIPYASVVEQMAVRRMPLGAFAARDQATRAFEQITATLQARLRRDCVSVAGSPDRRRLASLLEVLDLLTMRVEPPEGEPPALAGPAPSIDDGNTRAGGTTHPVVGARREDTEVVHNFDTDRRDLKRSGYVLELHEGSGQFVVVAAQSEGGREAGGRPRAHAQIDKSWAADILAGLMSPVTALDRRLGQPMPGVVERVRITLGTRKVVRVDSQMVRPSVIPPIAATA